MRPSFSPVTTKKTKITGLNTSNPNAANLKHAHVYTSIGHDDGRDYGTSGDNPSLVTHELIATPALQEHRVALSGELLSHQGISKAKGSTTWYTSDTLVLYKWADITGTPTPDPTNPTNQTPFVALEADTGLSGFDHIGGIQHAVIAGNEYIVAPVENDPGGTPGGICLYDSSLNYVNGSFSSFSGNRIGAVAVNEARNELYFVNFSTTVVEPIQVCRLSDALTGNLSIIRTITLGYPVLNINGIYARGNEIWVEGNRVGEMSVFPFDMDGNPIKVYRTFLAGIEDIDASDNGLLYWLSSPALSSGFIHTYDIAAAEELGGISSTSGGKILRNVSSASPSTSLQSIKSSNVGDQGTRFIRFMLKTSESGQIVQSVGTNSQSWNIDCVTQGGNTRARFYLLSGVSTLIETSPGGTSDDLPVDTEVSLAFTWNRITSTNIELNLYLNGVLVDSVVETTAAAWTELSSMAVGRGHRNSRASDLEVFHDYMYDTNLDAASILSIHNDPYGMFSTE